MGFTLDWHFASSHAILQALSPVLDRLVTDNRQMFTVEKQEAFSVIFTTLDGFQYTIEPSKIAVNFQHRLKIKQRSGAPPAVELLSISSPYSSLLPQVSSKLVEATLLLQNISDRKVSRIGVVSTTIVSEDQVPPGIEKFIGYIGRPWKRNIQTFNIQIVSELDKTPKWSDRCVHLLVKPEDKDQLPTLQFDWQRTLASERTIERDYLLEFVESAKKDAMKYFEELAEGSQFDEDIIRGV